jgi:hypothetical protein
LFSVIIEVENMENGFEMGKIENNNKPIDCKMNTVSSTTVQGWACDRVDCPSYGKWWCPFSW